MWEPGRNKILLKLKGISVPKRGNGMPIKKFIYSGTRYQESEISKQTSN